jgi:hypothetical protein
MLDIAMLALAQNKEYALTSAGVTGPQPSLIHAEAAAPTAVSALASFWLCRVTTRHRTNPRFHTIQHFNVLPNC